MADEFLTYMEEDGLVEVLTIALSYRDNLTLQTSIALLLCVLSYRESTRFSRSCGIHSSIHPLTRCIGCVVMGVDAMPNLIKANVLELISYYFSLKNATLQDHASRILTNLALHRTLRGAVATLTRTTLTPPIDMPLTGTAQCSEAIMESGMPVYIVKLFSESLSITSTSSVLEHLLMALTNLSHTRTSLCAREALVSLALTARCVALRCVALRCVALRCVALRCVALRCVALRARR